jgi:hypothetical protein
MEGKAKSLTAEESEELLKTLKKRFEKNMSRHENIDWNAVQSKLESSPEKLWTIKQMEESGGEPDVFGYDDHTSEFLFCDCSAESPAGRRNLCYDNEALESRKEYKPKGSAAAMASSMGAALMTEEEYRVLQELGNFDMKTSSWVMTPNDIRALGGAIFCDRRYDHVFTYHNGAESYYGNRGFRCTLRV